MNWGSYCSFRCFVYKRQSPHASNVAGAFALKEKGENALRSLRSVLLVDDIYTTGATLEACGDILCRTGVQEVYFVCLCIGKD